MRWWGSTGPETWSPIDVTTLAPYGDHMDVGIRELKAKLSEYVDRAAQGEVIRVTDRGVPKAVLMSLPAGDRVEQGVREGWIRAGVGGAPGGATPADPPPGRTTTEIIADDRGQ